MDYERYRAFFGALANSTCLAILQSLSMEPQTISDLARDLNFAQSRVSHAVSRLKNAGMVECRRVDHRKVLRMHRQALPLLECIDEFLDQSLAPEVPHPRRDADVTTLTWAASAAPTSD